LSHEEKLGVGWSGGEYWFHLGDFVTGVETGGDSQRAQRREPEGRRTQRLVKMRRTKGDKGEKFAAEKGLGTRKITIPQRPPLFRGRKR